MIIDVGEPSHPTKRLKDDHGAPGGPAVGGEAMPSLPFVTSFVSTMPEREDGDHTESLASADLRTIGASQRTSMPIMMSITTTTPTADPAVIAKEKLVDSSVFGADSSSAGGSHPFPGGFSDSTGSDFLIGGIRTTMVVSAVRWLMNSPLKFFASIYGIEHDQLFTEFNVGVVQQSLSAEVRMRAEYNIKEKRRLKSVVDEHTELLKVREKEIKILKAQLVKEAEVTEAIRLRAKASKFKVVERSLRDEAQVLKERTTTLEKDKSELEIKVADLVASAKVREQEVVDLDVLVRGLDTSSAELQEKVTAYESCIDQLEKFQDDKMKEVNDKFDQLYTDFIEMALHIEDKFYPHLLTTISERRRLLTHGMELAIAKYLNSTEYLSTLRAAIGKAVEKGMQDGLSVGITHDVEGRNLTDVAAYNPSAETNCISALQCLQSVNFSSIAELRSNKDASVKTIMNLLHQTVVCATDLSLSLDVSLARVQKIRENIANHRSALSDIFIPLAEPLSSVALEDDYEVVHADGQGGIGADANPLPNVDDVELNIQ
ncbi:hypothetical protein Tco_0738189 [Tanacetum coccineum]